MMFTHSVYFWLKDGLTDELTQRFMAGVKSLTTIPSVKTAYLGVPADTDRPVIDRTYSFALIVVFEDKAGHDLYQEHPSHDKFRTECEVCWDKVQIYDCV